MGPKVKIINSAGLGLKSKILKPKILYVSTDQGSELQNIYEVKSEYNNSDGLDKYIENLPKAKIEELIDFCTSKKIKEIHLGISDPHAYSHAYVIASIIDPDGGEFTITASGGKVWSFKGDRDFARFLRVTNFKMKAELTEKYEKLNRDGWSQYEKDTEWEAKSKTRKKTF